MAVQPALAAVLSGCSGPLSALDPAGPAAASISILWWVMLAGATALFALVVVLFALVIRFSIAASLLTKAPAISPAPKPHRMWRTRATCAVSDRRGWQQENIIRSRSSCSARGSKSSSTDGSNVHSLSKSRPSSGANVRAVRSLRSTSIARFFAVAISHAPGFAGGP